MHKKVILTVVSLLILSTLVFFTTAQLGEIVYASNPIDEGYLDTLTTELAIGCVQDSQCDEGYQCFKMSCVPEETVDLCQDVSIAPVSTPLFVTHQINLFRPIFTETLLPYLLADGSLVDEVNSEAVQYKYAQMIFIGNSELQIDGGQELIKTESDNFLYKYVIYFSNEIDFSDTDIQGQVLKILGNEYVIGDDSTNEQIYLISGDRKIFLQDDNEAYLDQDSLDGTKVHILSGSEGVYSIEIAFNENGNEIEDLTESNDYSDPLFSSSKLSFNSYSDRASISLGGNC